MTNSEAIYSKLCRLRVLVTPHPNWAVHEDKKQAEIIGLVDSALSLVKPSQEAQLRAALAGLTKWAVQIVSELRDTAHYPHRLDQLQRGESAIAHATAVLAGQQQQENNQSNVETKRCTFLL